MITETIVSYLDDKGYHLYDLEENKCIKTLKLPPKYTKLCIVNINEKEFCLVGRTWNAITG